MKKWIARKKFENKFAPFNKSGTQIWVITRVEKLPIEIINMAIILANLDFINFNSPDNTIHNLSIQTVDYALTFISIPAPFMQSPKGGLVNSPELLYR